MNEPVDVTIVDQHAAITDKIDWSGEEDRKEEIVKQDSVEETQMPSAEKYPEQPPKDEGECVIPMADGEAFTYYQNLRRSGSVNKHPERFDAILVSQGLRIWADDPL